MENTSKEKKLGNLLGFTGGNYAYNVYDPMFLCPVLDTCQGGGRQPHVILRGDKQ